jgi:hypothetical protein
MQSSNPEPIIISHANAVYVTIFSELNLSCYQKLFRISVLSISYCCRLQLNLDQRETHLIIDTEYEIS